MFASCYRNQEKRIKTAGCELTIGLMGKQQLNFIFMCMIQLNLQWKTNRTKLNRKDQFDALGAGCRVQLGRARTLDGVLSSFISASFTVGDNKRTKRELELLHRDEKKSGHIGNPNRPAVTKCVS